MRILVKFSSQTAFCRCCKLRLTRLKRIDSLRPP
ncbi:hypothetical protein DSM3645_03438 [Blastopirellula marina DSM 3645]|uniref:Uncharacterized protein n=1 Tax=Blastopirellula marina DSM 3645 TaxID=314230 RepID=A3ZW01_9BACT|nr:hypothetical protein DSM3645_03438 [Blastopirellula marina DSM 3645]